MGTRFPKLDQQTDRALKELAMIARQRQHNEALGYIREEMRERMIARKRGIKKSRTFFSKRRADT